MVAGGSDRVKTAEELRQLVQEIERCLETSKVYSVASAPVRNCIDHLSAIARIHEANQKIFELDTYCPWPNCNCPVSFPEGTKVTKATMCPNAPV